MKSAPTIAFDYTPSRLVCAALCVVATLAAMTPWFSALPVWICVLLSALAVGVAALAVRSLRAPPFVRIAYRGDGWVLLIARASNMRRCCMRIGISARS